MNNDEKIYPNYFAIIPADIRYDKDIPNIAKLLYAEITALCNNTGYCWATNNYFADLYGISKYTVSRSINILINHNYLVSKTVYKDNTKEIEKRILSIADSTINVGGIVKKSNRGIDDKRNRGIVKNRKGNNTSINNNIYSANFDKDDAFERFWSIYPRHTNKKKAYNSFIKKCTDETVLQKMLSAIVDQKETEQWQNEKFIPHPTTWLNGERWEDEIKTTTYNNQNNEDWMCEYE